MVPKDMFEIEKHNFDKIYLYIDAENNLCYSYEFSAYLLTRLLNTLKLEENIEKELKTVSFFTQLSIQLAVDRFFGSNTTVGDDCITVVLDDPNCCMQWKLEFDDLKEKQRKVCNCNRIIKSILGFFHFVK